MFDYLPCGCRPSDIDAADPFDDPIGLCAVCSAHCFADGESLVMPNGVLCPTCTQYLPPESLREYVAAIAPASWTEEDITDLIAELRP